MRLLSVSHDAKTVKNKKKGYLTGILYLAPTDISGYNVCPMASEGCRKACLFTAGRGRFQATQDGRIRKTLLFFEDRESFLTDLRWDIHALVRKADREDYLPCVRLNGTSDIWCDEYAELMYDFPDIVFYDYTKVPKRFDRTLPPNYSLTFSRSESNEQDALLLLSRGYNVAVVFDALPKTYKGYKVINGDLYDARFLDPQGVVVGLRAKGKAKKDNSGFVVKTQTKLNFNGHDQRNIRLADLLSERKSAVRLLGVGENSLQKGVDTPEFQYQCTPTLGSV